MDKSSASSAADMQAKLIRTRLVLATDSNGNEWAVKVRNVPWLIWDSKNEWLSKKLFKNEDSFDRSVEESVKNPGFDTLRAVFLSGVVDPVVGLRAGKETLEVDALLADRNLMIAIYKEIVGLSWEEPAAKQPEKCLS